jgi:ferric-dicitrate binding protein FerR (iron transport regulator)
MNRFFEWLSGKKLENLGAEEEKLFSELKSIWDASAKLPKPEWPDEEADWLRLQRRINAIEKKETERSKTGVRFPFPVSMKPIYGFAAMLILLIITSVFYTTVLRPERYTTQRGETRTIQLQDSTVVQLQGESSLTVNRGFNDDFRGVKLSGVAYFEVRHAESPFIIQSDFATTEVVGTKFNIVARKELFEVAVNEGSVRVQSDISDITKKDNFVYLSAGQYTRFKKGQQPSPPQQMPFEGYPSWIHGRLAFYDVTLKFAVKEIESRFDVKIELAPTVNADTKITGLFETKDIETVISALCLSIQKKYEVKNGMYKIF